MPFTKDFEAYAKALRRHDWHYANSDDQGVWRQGQAERRELLTQAKTHPFFMGMYDAYSKVVLFGQPGCVDTAMDAFRAQAIK